MTDVLPEVAWTFDDRADNDDIVNDDDHDDDCIVTPLSAVTTAEGDCDPLGAARHVLKRVRFAAENVNVSSDTTAKASCRADEIATEATIAKASCEADADPPLAKL